MPMDRSRKARGKLPISRRTEVRTLLLVLTITCVPVLATVVLITSTTEPDLADLKPKSDAGGKNLVLDWSALEQNRKAKTGPEEFSGAEVHAMGYMMEGDVPIKTGERITDFVLLPDSGNALHPAHRFGDQMVAVHLEKGNEVRFSPRRLVSAWGSLRTSPGDPAGPEPLYHLDQARAQLANREDLHRYYK
ncbi:MAG TPA: hypothetical protein VMO00_10875 [Methylomirabilota bacterium]|nr:hypothetical protein [Methylomirabilota bacterium]